MIVAAAPAPAGSLARFQQYKYQRPSAFALTAPVDPQPTPAAAPPPKAAPTSRPVAPASRELRALLESPAIPPRSASRRPPPSPLTDSLSDVDDETLALRGPGQTRSGRRQVKPTPLSPLLQGKQHSRRGGPAQSS